MIRARDITVVMQGDVREATLDAVRSVRQFLPGARLIFSSFYSENVDMLKGQVDDIVLSEDPGPLPPFTLATDASPNNLNRLIISSRAGLEPVETPYILKLRSDCLLNGDAFLDYYNTHVELGNDVMLASSFYTRHPRGLSCYLFHLSDWFGFSSTQKMRLYWRVPLMTLEEARWFEQSPHLPGSAANAKRFRARYTPEQYVCTRYAQMLGYKVPAFLNERNAPLTKEYERFLARECLIAEPERLNIILPKYQRLGRVFYQRLDCTSYKDWQLLYSQYAGKSTPPRDTINHLRPLAHRLRHIIIGYSLLLHSLKLRLKKRKP